MPPAVIAAPPAVTTAAPAMSGLVKAALITGGLDFLGAGLRALGKPDKDEREKMMEAIRKHFQEIGQQRSLDQDHQAAIRNSFDLLARNYNKAFSGEHRQALKSARGNSPVEREMSPVKGSRV